MTVSAEQSSFFLSKLVTFHKNAGTGINYKHIIKFINVNLQPITLLKEHEAYKAIRILNKTQHAANLYIFYVVS